MDRCPRFNYRAKPPAPQATPRRVEEIEASYWEGHISRRDPGFLTALIDESRSPAELSCNRNGPSPKSVSFASGPTPVSENTPRPARRLRGTHGFDRSMVS